MASGNKRIFIDLVPRRRRLLRLQEQRQAVAGNSGGGRRDTSISTAHPCCAHVMTNLTSYFTKTSQVSCVMPSSC